MKIRFLKAITFFAIFLFIGSCVKQEESSQKKLLVVTTLFPLYDFAKRIGKDKVSVTLLLPPGVEAHSYEPTPEDVLKINKAKVFVYTGLYMEPWVEKVLKSIDNKNLVIVDSSRGIEFLEKKEEDDRDHHHKNVGKIDPHIWLDFLNAKTMVDNMLQGFIKADKENSEFYKNNAKMIKKELNNLDEKYKKGLSDCKTRDFYHGGHFAFNYLANRYNLHYVSVYTGISPDEEPQPKRVAQIIRDIKNKKLKYIYYEEFLSPRIAEIISKEAGVTMLKINAGHNVSKEQLERGISFFDIMEENLKQLKVGLQCQQ